MLHKCANPSCASPFRRLSEGKLFLVESDVQTGPPSLRYNDGQGRPARHIEHYWLCNQCASVFTLCFEQGRGMVTVPLTLSPRKLPATSIRTVELAAGRQPAGRSVQKMA